VHPISTIFVLFKANNSKDKKIEVLGKYFITICNYDLLKLSLYKHFGNKYSLCTCNKWMNIYTHKILNHRPYI